MQLKHTAKIAFLSFLIASIATPAHGWWLTDWICGKPAAQTEVQTKTAATTVIAVAAAAFLLPTVLLSSLLYSWHKKNVALCRQHGELTNEINAVKAEKMELGRNNSELRANLSLKTTALETTKTALETTKTALLKSNVARYQVGRSIAKKTIAKDKFERTCNKWTRNVRKKRAQTEHDKSEAQRRAAYTVGAPPRVLTTGSATDHSHPAPTNAAPTSARATELSATASNAPQRTADAKPNGPTPPTAATLSLAAQPTSSIAIAATVLNAHAPSASAAQLAEEKKKRDEADALHQRGKAVLYPNGHAAPLPAHRLRERRGGTDEGQRRGRTLHTVDRQTLAAALGNYD